MKLAGSQYEISRIRVAFLSREWDLLGGRIVVGKEPLDRLLTAPSINFDKNRDSIKTRD
jgi:hypothetical protein